MNKIFIIFILFIFANLPRDRCSKKSSVLCFKNTYTKLAQFVTVKLLLLMSYWHYIDFIHQVKDKIAGEDRKKITDKCDETIRWLDSNPEASKEEYQDKLQEMEQIANPIIRNLYSAAQNDGMADEEEFFDDADL